MMVCVGLVFWYVVVYLDGDGCHVGDRDLVHYCYVQVFFVVYRHVRFMFVFVSFQRVALSCCVVI
jgi:hypothetical protein